MFVASRIKLIFLYAALLLCSIVHTLRAIRINKLILVICDAPACQTPIDKTMMNVIQLTFKSIPTYCGLCVPSIAHLRFLG